MLMPTEQRSARDNGEIQDSAAAFGQFTSPAGSPHAAYRQAALSTAQSPSRPETGASLPGLTPDPRLTLNSSAHQMEQPTTQVKKFWQLCQSKTSACICRGQTPSAAARQIRRSAMRNTNSPIGTGHTILSNASQQTNCLSAT